MANIQKTAGVVLSTKPFKESSLLCYIYTKRFGKITVLAKGARRPKSKFCGTLEPFTHTEIIFYKKENREIYTLSDSVVLDSFDRVRSSTLKVNACQVLCELVIKTSPAEENDPNVYFLLLSFVERIQSANESLVKSLIFQFLLKALKVIGIAPYLKDCIRCHQKADSAENVVLSVAAGGLVCGIHFDDTIFILNRETAGIMQKVLRNEEVLIDTATLNELKEFVPQYMEYHTHGITLNSLKFIK